MKNIRNIIFDLGGVIIDLDYSKTSKAFRELGMNNFDELYSQAQQSGWFDQLDKGTLSAEEFRSMLRHHLPEGTTDIQIDAAWDAMLLGVPQERLDMLLLMKKKYRTFLLSNTNEIHVRNFSSYLERTYGFREFNDHFEKWYYSCRIGMRKPDAEIFEFVLNENQLKPEETLFIDDSIQHIRGAEALGIRTAYLDKHTDVIDLIQTLKLI